MIHAILGILAIILGLLGLSLSWYQFLDLVFVVLPVAVLIYGIIALMAGVESFKTD